MHIDKARKAINKWQFSVYTVSHLKVKHEAEGYNRSSELVGVVYPFREGEFNYNWLKPFEEKALEEIEERKLKRKKYGRS